MIRRLKKPLQTLRQAKMPQPFAVLPVARFHTTVPSAEKNRSVERFIQWLAKSTGKSASTQRWTKYYYQYRKSMIGAVIGSIISGLIGLFFLFRQVAINKANQADERETDAEHQKAAEIEQVLGANKQYLRKLSDLTEVNPRLYLFNDPTAQELATHEECDRLLQQKIADLALYQETVSLHPNGTKLAASVSYQLQELTIAQLMNKAQWQHKLRHYISAPEGLSAVACAKQALEKLKNLPDTANGALNCHVLTYVTLSWQAKSHAAAGQQSSALDSYTDAIDIAHDTANISSKLLAILYSCKGALLNDMGQHAEALLAHNAAYQRVSNDVGIISNRAYGLRLQAKFEEEALVNVPITEQATLVKQIADQRREAKLDLKKLMENAEALPYQKSQAYLYLGIVYMDENNATEALNCFTQGLKLQPNHPTMLRRKALALADQGQYQEALTALQDAKVVLTRQAQIPAFQVWLTNIEPRLKEFEAHLAYQKGHQSEAKSLFNQALKLETQPDAKHLLLANIRQLEGVTDLAQPTTPCVSSQELGLITPYEYAILSNYVYNPVDLPSGWITDEKWQKEMPKYGYKGAIFINHLTRDIVVAHRGSANFTNVLTDAKLMLNQLDEYKQYANELTRQAEALTKAGKTQGYRLSHTGHSLGGAIAELLAYDYQREAVSFESPGVRDILECRTEANPHPILDGHRANQITAYLAEPNLINTARLHVGKLIRIYPLTKPTESSFVWGYFTRLWGVNDVIKTKQRHALGPIVELFEQAQQNNTLLQQGLIKQWPSGIIGLGYQTYERYAERAEKEQGSRTAINQLDKNTLETVVRYVVDDYIPQQLEIKELSPLAQEFLQNYQNPGHRYYQQNPYGLDARVLQGYDINGSKVKIKCGLTEQAFKQYLNKQIKPEKLDNLVKLSGFQAGWHTKAPLLSAELQGNRRSPDDGLKQKKS